MRSISRRRLLVACIAASTLAVAACGDDDATTASTASTTTSTASTTTSTASTSGPAAGSTTTAGTVGNEASDTGVTPTAYTVGFLWSATGPAAPGVTGMLKAAQARVAVQNEQGGVFGREIVLVEADDASTPTQNLGAAQSLIQNDEVFVLINQSAFVFGSYRYTNEVGIPVIGGGYDGPEWFQQPNTNMVSVGGNNSEYAPQYTGLPTFIKEQGGSRVAAMGYGQSPSSSTSARKFHDLAAPAAGLTPAYLNTSIPFGSVDVATIALDMRNANVDSVYLPMINTTNFAIVTAARQAGVDLKVAVSATGYGQSLLDQPTAVEAAQGAFFAHPWVPVELETEATKEMQDALAEHADFDGVPGFDYLMGWLSADLLIKGLEAAGQNPTRQSFLEGLRSAGTFDGGGLLAKPADISLTNFGKAPTETCGFYMRLDGSRFVPVPAGGKPVCGTLVPGTDQ